MKRTERKSHEEWLQIISDQEHSGQDMAEYCEQRGLSAVRWERRKMEWLRLSFLKQPYLVAWPTPGCSRKLLSRSLMTIFRFTVSKRY
jgi:hypothetical protein